MRWHASTQGEKTYGDARAGPEGGFLNTPARTLPPAVLEALGRGQLIEAIKLLRASGIGLKDAKDLIDTIVKSKTAAPAAAPPSFSPGGMSRSLPLEVISALQRNQKIEAVRLMREQTGLGLKEAKEAVDKYERSRTPAMGGLSPGQVSETGSTVWRVITVVLVCLAVYLVMRRLA